MSNTVVLLLPGGAFRASYAFTGALTISSTSNSLSFTITTVSVSNNPSAKYIKEIAPNVACWTSTQAGVWPIGQELYEMTFVPDIAQEICVRKSVSRHI